MNEKLTVAIGTASQYKLNAIKKVFYELDLNYDFVNAAVDSNIAEQPKTAGETQRGSVNRARNILSAFPEADIGLGVEFGYEPYGSGYRMACWASIIDKDGNIYSEQSSTLTLPKMFREALENDVEVDDIVWKFIDSIRFSEVKNSLSDFVLKNRSIYECVENVVVRYVMREIF